MNSLTCSGTFLVVQLAYSKQLQWQTNILHRGTSLPVPAILTNLLAWLHQQYLALVPGVIVNERKDGTGSGCLFEGSTNHL